LADITRLLAAQYQLGVSLKGVIYLHRITDPKFTGSARKTLEMFQKLCGEEALGNVILATTMWDKVDRNTGAFRENELRDKFWKFMMNRGATMTQFAGGKDSAKAIISQLLGKRNVVLDIQREIGDECKSLEETTAGAAVNSELARIKKEVKLELQQLKEIRGALKESGREMQDIRRNMTIEMEKLRAAEEQQRALKRNIST
jgi:hypothetical protein